MKTREWSTPDDLTRQVDKLWTRGLILAERVGGDNVFPCRLRLARPKPADFNDDFNRVRDWVSDLVAGDRSHRGFGYEIDWRTVNHRVHGANQVPAAAIVPTAQDALKLIGKTAAARRFDQLAASVLDAFPEIKPWLIQRPLIALKHNDDWPRLLSILAWFKANPRPGIYLRQLDIEQVDTKFIEQHRKVISELLDRVLPEDMIDKRASGVRSFDRRFGLRRHPVRVRFRILDAEFKVKGLDDLTVPAEQFAALDMQVNTVFITENEVNGLAFPDHPDAIVIFGLGYGLDRLAATDWLSDKHIHYWGDIDSHGFAILNRLRHYLPHAQSLLMDRATLDAHRSLWVKEPAERRFTGQLDQLQADELELFNALRDDLIGDRVRLEQERIGFCWLRGALDSLKR